MDHAAKKSTPDITVVVCTYNGIDILPISLDALAKQSIADRVQIVVVDDGSTEDPSAVVKRYDVEYLPLTANVGVSAARNAGIALARAPIVAFTDQDVAVPTDWAEQLLARWAGLAASVVALGGEVTVARTDSLTQRYLAEHTPLAPLELDAAESATFIQRLRAYLRSHSSGHDTIRPVFSLVGANMSFRRDALDAVGGFDNTIRFGGDEVKVCTLLRERYGDAAVLCDGSIKVAHYFEPQLSDTLRRAYAYGSGNGLTFARQGGIPSLRPTATLFTLVLATVSFVNPLLALLVAFAVPLLVWRKWLRDAVRLRSAERLAFPFIALSQELVNNIGFVSGWVANIKGTRVVK